MKLLISTLFTCGLLIQANICMAQQSETFGNFEVHYNVINSNLLPAQVAQGYGIKRSSSRVLLNITVIDKTIEASGTPVQAQVTTSTINLTGQRRSVEMRVILEPDGAIYYIGELPIANMETYNFTVQVQPQGEPEPFELSFRWQFYTE
ncbi:MAG TPA: DUF4426 domain-containing protein [Xanthomonadales bacterium]|nr:DUF4426 domain-containing protein [Xanthomonadales bacterium]